LLRSLGDRYRGRLFLLEDDDDRLGLALTVSLSHGSLRSVTLAGGPDAAA
jgi:hypothetical protein